MAKHVISVPGKQKATTGYTLKATTYFCANSRCQLPLPSSNLQLRDKDGAFRAHFCNKQCADVWLGENNIRL